MLNSLDILDLAERVEELAGQIYGRLSEHFEANPEAREGFAKLAAEERQHKARVHMLRSEYLKTPERFGHLPIAAETLKSLVAMGEQVLAKLNGPPVEIDIDAAIEVMLRFEEMTAEVHAQRLAQAAAPDTRGFFEMLATQDRAHAAFLRTQRL